MTQTERIRVLPNFGGVLTVTPVLDTSAYATGDVLFNPIAIASALKTAGGAGELTSLALLDEDNQGIALDLVFMDTANNLGTINAAVSISAANARAILGIVSIAASDYVALVGSKIATKLNLGLILRTVASSTELYVAGITRGAPTHTVSGIKLKLGFRTS